MDGQFQVAQASGSGNSNHSAPRIFKLTKPLTDQAVVINLGYDQKTQLDFTAIANEKITLVHAGEKLIILFDNHATVTVEPFFDSRHDALHNLSVEVAPGRDVSVSEFASLFPITDDQSVLPAAGNGDANAQASGANFSNPAVDPLAIGNPLPLLGPETLPGFAVTNPTNNVLPVTAPTTTTAPATLLAPTADNFTTAPVDEDSTVSGNLISHVHAGQSGDTLTITAGTFTTPDGATVVLKADGSYTYTPDTTDFRATTGVENMPVGSHITDTFTFTVTDNHGGTSTATATVTVSIPAEQLTVQEERPTQQTQDDATLTVDAAHGVLVGVTHDVDDPIHVVNAGTFTTAQGGTVVLHADGSYTYDPNTIPTLETTPANNTLFDSFSFTVTDGHGDTASGTEHIRITINEPGPTANNATVATDEDTAITRTVSFTPGDPDDNVHVVAGTVTTADGVQVTIDSTGQFTYDPTSVPGLFETLPAGQTTTDSFTFTVTDGHGQTSTATETITISVNDPPPTATNGTAATDEDTAISHHALTFTTGDPDDSGHLVTGTVATTDGGTATINADGTFSYNPNSVPGGFETLQAGQTTTDSFSFSVTDSHGQTSTATETITISVNDPPPTATNGTAATDEDTAISHHALTFTTGDPDDSGHLVTGTVATTDGGTATINADGTFSYNPNSVPGGFETLPAGQTTTDSFSFSVTDSHGQTSTATETITISVNDPPPTATNGTAATDEDTAISHHALTFTTGDPDDSGHLVTGTVATTDGGTATINADGTFSYNPNSVPGGFETLPAGQTTTDSFSFSVTDSHGQTSTATETITISVNDPPPTATNGTAATDEDTAISHHALTFTTGDPDDSGHLVTGTVATTDGGTATINADGTFSYNPNSVPGGFETLPAGQTTTDSFSFSVTDSHGQTSTATETITISVNDPPPTATNGTAATDEDTAISHHALTFTTGDPDDSGHLVTGTVATTDGGTATINADGTFSYNPNSVPGGFETLPAGQTTTDSFSFSVTDSHGQTSTATETITISVNDPPPTATNGTAATDEDTAISHHALTFTTGDPDDSGHLVTGTVATTDGGTATINADGTFSYNPNSVPGGFETLPAGQTTTDSFSFSVTDSHGQTSTATETITISVNDPPPTATNGTAATDEDTAISHHALTFTTGDPDDSGHLVTGTVATTDGGTATINADGTFSYNPNSVPGGFETLPAGQTTTDSFSFSVTDSHGQTSTATETITISVNDPPPTATNGTAATDEDTAISHHALTFTTGDPDDSGHLVTGTVATTDGGTATINADGTFSYNPNSVPGGFETLPAGQTTTDSFSFSVTDSHGQTSTATETITISVNDPPPTATNGTAATDEDTAISHHALTFTTGDPDDSGHLVTGTVATTDGGTATINADGTFSYNPNSVPGGFETLPAGQTTTDSFSFSVTDSHGQTSTATETITISVNDPPPTATNGTAATDEDTAISHHALTFTTGDPDDSGHLVTGTVATTDGGTATINADGTFSYNPNSVPGGFETLPAGQTTTDSFSFSVTDSHGQTSTATETITISVNDPPPTATNGTAATDEDTAISHHALTFTTGDPDDSGHLVTGTVATTDGGTATINADGTFSYNPNSVPGGFETLPAGQTTTDSFSFSVTDSHGQTSTATETITISVNDPPPTATNGTAATDEDTAISHHALTFTTGDPDDSGHLVTGTVATTDGGTATINADGTFSYNPNSVPGGFETLPAGQTTTDSFSFSVTDSHGQTSTATETITISVNDPPPTATNGTAATDEDTAISHHALTFTTGDPDDSGHLVTGTVATTDGGTATINADGTFSYNPNSVPGGFETLPAGQTTTDSFSFSVTDSHGQTSTATETITISVNDPPPTATNGTAATDEDHAVNGQLTFTTGDPDDNGHLTTVGTVATADGGTVTINANGTFSYNPNSVPGGFETLPEGQTTTDSFSFSVTDSHGQTSTATETITVTGDRPPTPTNLSETAVSDFNAGFFSGGDTGNLHVTATFPAHPANEVQTIDIKLATGFTATDLSASGTSWHDTHTGLTYNYSYTYNSATGEIVVTVPGGASATDTVVPLDFDIKAPATITSTNLDFKETVTTAPAGDAVDGSIPVASGGDLVSAVFDTGIPPAHLLNTTIITNTNNNHQEIVVSFIDKDSPLDAAAFIVDTSAQGQQGNVQQDAGFNISQTDHFLVDVDQPFLTSKVGITNFTINGITMHEGSGNIQLTADDSQGAVHGFSAAIALNGPTSVLGHDSIGTTSNTTTVTGGATDPDFLFGGGNTDTLNGTTGSDFLASTGSGSILNGNGGVDEFIYTSAGANHYNGSVLPGSFDILRIDDGAIFNTHLEDPLASLGPTSVANAETVGSHHFYVEDLSGALLSDMNEILLTNEAAVVGFNPASYGTELTGLSVGKISTATDPSTTVNDFNNGFGHAPTSETWLHAMFVTGSSGDDVQLSLSPTGWTDSHTTLTTSSGTVFEHYIPTGTTLATATANLFIDNVLQVNAGTHAA